MNVPITIFYCMLKNPPTMGVPISEFHCIYCHMKMQQVLRHHLDTDDELICLYCSEKMLEEKWILYSYIKEFME